MGDHVAGHHAGMTNLMSSDHGAKAFVREYTMQGGEKVRVLKLLVSPSQKPRSTGRSWFTAQNASGVSEGRKRDEEAGLSDEGEKDEHEDNEDKHEEGQHADNEDHEEDAGGDMKDDDDDEQEENKGGMEECDEGIE